MNPEAQTEYQRKLEEASEKVIANLKRKRDHLGLSYEELKDEIKASIKEKILPIADEYDSLLAGEINIDTPLAAISKKIKSAFEPVKEPIKKDEDEEDVDSESDDLESLKTYQKILDKIAFYTQAIAEIGKIKNEIVADPGFSKSNVVAGLAPFLDLFFEAGLKVDFVVTVEREGFDDPVELHKNDTILLKDIAMAIKLNKDARGARARRDIESFTESVFGRLQIPKDEVPTTPKRIISMLAKEFFNLVPDFKNLKVALIDQTIELAKKKKDTYEDSTQRINKNYEKIFNPKLGDLKTVLDDFGDDLTHRGYEKGKISKKKQDGLTDELNDKTKVVLMELGSMRRPVSEKKNSLNELLSLIQSYEEDFAANEDDEASGKIDKKELKRLQNSLQDKLILKASKIAKSIDLKKEQLEDSKELEQAKSTIKDEIYKADSVLIMYDFFQDELVRQRTLFIEEWGLDEFTKDIENREVDSLSPWEIVKYVIKKEVAFWTPLHQESDNEFLRALVDKIKYNFMEDGKGYESNGSRMGTDDDAWSNSEGRTIMGLLQTYALYASSIHGEHFAEGKKDELFNNLRAFKITREGLYGETLGHPVYGPYLTKIMEISQYLPTLRQGSLPPIAILSDLNLLKSKMIPDQYEIFKDRLGRAVNPSRLVVLHERNVIREGKSIKLAADRFVKDDDGNWAFYPGEETLPTDQLILTSNPDFSYQTLSGNIGRTVASRLHEFAAELIDNNPEQFGLTKDDIPKNEDNVFAVQTFAQFLFYSFPFLTKIYADYELQTQTASHTVKSETLNWNKLFSPLGEAIQDSDRYGLRSALMWIFVYYAPFKEGLFGASGNSTRINRIQKLMIAHQKFVFGEDAMSHIAGQLDAHNYFGLPLGFTTALDMIKISEGEISRLFGDIIHEDGRVNPGSFENPHKIGPKGDIDADDDGKKVEGLPAYDWDLFLLSAKAYLKLLETTIKDIEVGSLTLHDLEQGELNPITQLLFKVMGQFKMWFFGNEDSPANVLKKSSPLVFHAFLRHAHATKRERPADVVKIFSAIMKAVESSLGIIGSGPKVNRGLGSGSVSKAVAVVHEWMEGHHDERVYSDGKPNWGEAISRGLGGQPMLDPKICDGFTPLSGSCFDARQPLLIDYLKLLWEDFSEEYTTKENPDGLGKWPFVITADLGIKYVAWAPSEAPIKLSGRTNEWTEIVDWFRARILRKEPVSSPLKRPKFD
jgi:hypothetical protein